MDPQEFFTVHHKLTVNVEPLEDTFILPSQEIFISEIPAPFIVASEFSQLDSLTEKAMNEFKNNDFKHIIHLLEHQNDKLNLLLTFMLAQQDSEEYRVYTTKFGASQLTYNSDSSLPVGSKVRVKLFLDHPPAAIYCYAKVSQCDKVDQDYEMDQVYETTLVYEILREIDQDLLIRSALYQQQKLLRQRSIDRQKQ